MFHHYHDESISAAVLALLCATVLAPLACTAALSANSYSSTGVVKSNQPSAAGGTKGAHILQGAVFQSELIDQLERAGITCAARDANLKALTINSVRLGSDAYYKGLSAGDEIKTLQLKSTTLTIVATRSGKPYQVQLEVAAATEDVTRSSSSSSKTAGLQKSLLNGSVDRGVSKIVDINGRQNPIVDVGGQKIPVVDVGRSKLQIAEVTQQHLPIIDINPKKLPIVEVPPKGEKPEDVLKFYDVELIIDRTGSMSQIDGTGEKTKFEWCHDQVRNFVDMMHKYNHGINITVFNTDFQTFYNCTPGKVEQIYTEYTPEGRTDLVDPLMSRLNAIRGAQRKGGRPTLIAVIHDGLPNVPVDPHAVNEALINFSRTLDDPNQILITFLQIGDTFDGRDFCVDLDDNLVNEGAKYDIVDTCTFPELKKVGLAKALVEALEEKQSASAKNHGTAFTVHSDARKNMIDMLTHSESGKQLSDLDKTLKARQAERKALDQVK